MPRRLGVSEVNAHVMCTLCDGYLVDATTIMECLHAFCRTCIVRYLECSKYCPVCDVQVHKTKPLSSIRSDQTLQDVVYKMVPGLYQSEMQRRRDFYAEHAEAGSTSKPEERGEGDPRFFSPKESVSLCLQHKPKEQPKAAETSDIKDPTLRHLSCPAAFTIGHLKKFVHLKFSLPHTFSVDIFYDDHQLRDSFTLMDVAYIYSWKRAEPMQFFYTIRQRVRKQAEPPSESTPAAETAVVSEEVDIDAHPVEEQQPPPMDEPMDVDSKPTEAKAEKSPPPVSVVEPLDPHSEGFGASVSCSTPDSVQPMDVSESEVSRPNSSPSPVASQGPTLMPEPTYNSVKLVSAPERNTLLSPTNGFRLKFIHDPELSPKSSSSRSSKKSGRKGGRSSRHKSVPVRLARLAPYPPPPTPVPVTCLTTQHLSQLTVGKLIPSVITTLAPTFVTTLVSTASNTQLCNVANDSSPFLSPVCRVSTGAVPAATEGGVSSSSALPESPHKCLPDTKKLPSTETSSPNVVPSCESSRRISMPFLSIQDALSTSGVISVQDNNKQDSTAIKSSDSPSAKTGDGSGSSIPASRSVEVESSENVTSTSVDVNPVPTVTTTTTTTHAGHTDSDSRGSFREHSRYEPHAPKTTDVKPDSFKLSVKNSILAEFSDNDDLGCQPDLVVDEQKMDSSDDNEEEEEDTALRKKINAIAEKEDETDDTEADSGRASDMSCPARCEEDVGSPMTTETVTSTSATVPSVSVTTVPPPEETHRPGKPSNSIDHVIKQLYLQHELGRSPSSPKPVASSPHPNPAPPPPPPPPPAQKSPLPSSPKDESGVLDLSTCTRKPGDVQSTRSKPVANPVLDFKHRQQTYLPAPVKQHTACPPAPKHPTSSLLMHQLTTATHHHHAATPSILQAQLTGGAKPPSLHLHPHHHHHGLPYSIPVSRSGGTSSSTERPSYASYKFSPNAAHQGVFSGMFPMMNLAAGYGLVPPGLSLPPRSPSSSASHHQKECGANNSGGKMSFGFSKASGKRVQSPTGRSAALPTSPSSMTMTSTAPTHPRTSPSMVRMSPLHRSASPTPSPQSVASMVNHCGGSLTSVVNKNNHCALSPSSSAVSNSGSLSLFGSSASSALGNITVTTTSSSNPSASHSHPYRAVHGKKSEKGPNSRTKKRPNLAVFNLDPNGFRQKLVIKNMDSKQNNTGSNHH